MGELIYKEESNLIIGAAIEVQMNMGIGFLEPVYQEVLEMEFAERGIPFEREKELLLSYKGKELKKRYYADFVCYDKIILELKVCDKITKIHESQVINYLNATNFKLGIIMNFAVIPLEFKRIVL
jgi:GxxExxY protein